MAGCNFLLPGTTFASRYVTDGYCSSFCCIDSDIQKIWRPAEIISVRAQSNPTSRFQSVQAAGIARSQTTSELARGFVSRPDYRCQTEQSQTDISGSQLRFKTCGRYGHPRSLTFVQALPSSNFSDWLRPSGWVASPANEQASEKKQGWQQGRDLAEENKALNDGVWNNEGHLRGDPWGKEDVDGCSTSTSDRRLSPPSPSTLFTTLLINYSLLISDWWQFKHTAKERMINAILSSSVTQTVSRVAMPVAATVGKLSSPVTSTVSKIDILQAGTFFDRFRRKSDSALVDPNERGEAATPGLRGDGESSSSDEAVTSVTQDDLDPSILWGRRRKDVEAEEARSITRSPGFSFSAAGLLFPYHLGATQCLMDTGYIKEDTPLAGSSAGAIVCAVVASGLCMQQALASTKELALDCRQNGTAFRLGFVLRQFLEEFLPEDAHERSSGRIRVAVTQVFRSPRGLLVDKFDSREDLINCLITSSFVPGYLAPAPVTWFRDRYCVDGGLSLFMPPTASQETVRICAFPASAFGLGGIGISPDLNPANRATTRQLFGWALEPAEDHVLDDLFEQGYQDALSWVQQNATKKPNLLVL